MKVGDLVSFKKSFLGNKRGDVCFLVIKFVQTWGGKRSSSPFSKWQICNTMTGKVYIQNARDLEVINESR